MILHLVNDEKVIPRTIQLFEEFLPDSNFYLCFKDRIGPLTHVSNVSSNNLSVYSKDADYSDLVSKCDTVVVHFLNPQKMNFCKRFIVQKSVRLIWIAWGGDLYGALYARGFRLFTFDNTFFRYKWLLSVYDYLWHFISKKDSQFRDFVKNYVTDLFINHEEYRLLLKYFSLPPQKVVSDFYYYPIDSILNDLYCCHVANDSRTILCGNSASITNNHETSFKFIKKFIDNNTKVIVPLSYGGTKWYIGRVNASGKKLLGNAYCPLHDFLPINEYNRILLSARICIFSNRRQEAFGNIVISLYLGAKVYFLRDNPLFDVFSAMGVKVFLMSDNITSVEFWTPLSSHEVEMNRKILAEKYSKNRLKEVIIREFKSSNNKRN